MIKLQHVTIYKPQRDKTENSSKTCALEIITLIKMYENALRGILFLGNIFQNQRAISEKPRQVATYCYLVWEAIKARAIEMLLLYLNIGKGVPKQ